MQEKNKMQFLEWFHLLKENNKPTQHAIIAFISKLNNYI